MPWSSRTLKVVYSGMRESRMPMVAAEKPHIGCVRVPFMKSTTRSDSMSDSICDFSAELICMGISSGPASRTLARSCAVISAFDAGMYAASAIPWVRPVSVMNRTGAEVVRRSRIATLRNMLAHAGRDTR